MANKELEIPLTPGSSASMEARMAEDLESMIAAKDKADAMR